MLDLPYQPSSCFSLAASASDFSATTFGVDHGSVFNALYRFSSYAATRTVVSESPSDMNVTSRYEPVCLYLPVTWTAVLMPASLDADSISAPSFFQLVENSLVHRIQTGGVGDGRPVALPSAEPLSSANTK